MGHPVIVEAMARERRKDLIREAEQRRLVSKVRQGQPGLADGLLAEAGERLSAAGEKLQARRGPQASQEPRWARR